MKKMYIIVAYGHSMYWGPRWEGSPEEARVYSSWEEALGQCVRLATACYVREVEGDDYAVRLVLQELD